jgi:hypothetical protein
MYEIGIMQRLFRKSIANRLEWHVVENCECQKLRGMGRLFGFNIFLNQRIQVALTASGPVQIIGIEEVRQLVKSAIRGKQQWDSMEDFDEFTAIIDRAQTISEITAAVAAAYYRSISRDK